MITTVEEDEISSGEKGVTITTGGAIETIARQGEGTTGPTETDEVIKAGGMEDDAKIIGMWTDQGETTPRGGTRISARP